MTQVYVVGGGGSPSITAWIAVVISLVSLGWAWYSSRRSERRSYRDSYWFREVLAPSCLDPVLSLRATWCDKALGLVGTTIDGPELRVLVSAVQQDTSKIIRSMWVARIFDSGFHQAATEALSTIEDVVADVIYVYVRSAEPFDKAGADNMIDRLTEQCLIVLQQAASLHAGNMKISATRSRRN